MTYGTVTNFEGHATVRFDRHIPASPQAVWAALTKDAALAVWLAPGTIEPRSGGEVSLDFGEDQKVAGTVLLYEPAQLLESSWTFTDEPNSILRFELSTADGGTRLVLEHSKVPPDQGPGYGAGWHAHLDMLAAHIVGEDPIDWDERFSAVLGTYVGA